jgi:hypothetical protein
MPRHVTALKLSDLENNLIFPKRLTLLFSLLTYPSTSPPCARSYTIELPPYHFCCFSSIGSHSRLYLALRTTANSLISSCRAPSSPSSPTPFRFSLIILQYRIYERVPSCTSPGLCSQPITTIVQTQTAVADVLYSASTYEDDWQNVESGDCSV